MVKLRISYETPAELAALVHILTPYTLSGGRFAEKQGRFNRLYITLDPEKLEQVFAILGKM